VCTEGLPTGVGRNLHERSEAFWSRISGTIIDHGDQSWATTPCCTRVQGRRAPLSHRQRDFARAEPALERPRNPVCAADEIADSMSLVALKYPSNSRRSVHSRLLGSDLRVRLTVTSVMIPHRSAPTQLTPMQ